MDIVWKTIAVIEGIFGFIGSIIIGIEESMILGFSLMLSTFFTSLILYSIGEYFHRSDNINEMLKKLLNELKSKNLESLKENCNNYHDKESNLQGQTLSSTVSRPDSQMAESSKEQKVIPIINEKDMECPLCHCKQTLGRNVCWNCGAKFYKED